MKKKNVAVIGAGYLGRIHARLLKTVAGVQPFVVETDEQTRNAISTEHDIPAFETVSDIGEKLDGAIIVTPTETHFQVASQLLEKGCHLLVEKPICATADEARRLCMLAERNELTLQVGHVERFNPAFVAARSHMQDVVHLECTRHTPYSFRATDVSVIQDLMIHDIDLALSAIGSEVVNVRANGTRIIGPHWDAAVAWLEFENGSSACLRASRVSHQADRSMNCISNQGSVNIDFVAQTVKVMQSVNGIREKLESIPADEIPTAREQMFEKWLPVHDVEISPQNAILEEQKEFVSCINDKGYPSVSGRDGLKAVEVAEAILSELIVESTENATRRTAA